MRLVVSILVSSLLMGSITCTSLSRKPASRTKGDFTKIAFIGDTGAGHGFKSVLQLIKAENVDLVVVLGDTDYKYSEEDWDQMVREILPSEPAIVVMGNHDYTDSNHLKVAELGRARLLNRSDIQCRGTYGERFVCSLGGVYMVFSSIPFGDYTHESHEKFIAEELDRAPAGHWRICGWHANQKAMQLGDKDDEVGWTAYETCRKKGAIIASAHEHSYSRTFALSDMTQQTRASTDGNNLELSEGVSFAFVSGLGGHSIRPQRRSGAHWASMYTSTQDAFYGALFAEFSDDKAIFYFKNIQGEIIDQFNVTKKY